MPRIVIALLSFLFLVPQGLRAAAPGLSKVPLTSCAVTSTTAFSTTDTAVYTFFDVTGLSVGDTFIVAFYGPSGQLYTGAGGQFDFSPAPSAGEACYVTNKNPLLIAGNQAATMPGTWTVDIFYNNNFNTAFASGTFTITAASTSSTVYYRFENGTAGATATGSGSIVDSMGTGQNGTPSGAVTYSSDVPLSTVGGAANKLSLQLASNGSVQFPGAFPLNSLTNATLEFYIKPAGTGSLMFFLWTRTDSTDANRFNMGVVNGNSVGLDYREPNGTQHVLTPPSYIAIASSGWTHVAVVKSGNTWTSYANGVQQGPAVTDANPNLPTNTGWTLNGSNLNQQFAGLIDELRISNSALTPSQFLAPPSAASCTYSLATSSASVAAGAGSGSFTVTTGTGCTLSSATADVTWITPTISGSTVNYTVQANTSTSSRIGHITVNGQTFTVTQAAASVTCSYSLSAASASIAAGGGSASFNVNVTAGTGCTLSASSDVTWITPTISGSTVNYTVQANTSTSSRIGHITVNGQTFTVTQAGAMAPGGPAIGTGGVVSAADYSADLAPGSLISIFGKNLAPSILQASKTPLPTTLNGTSVQISGTGGTAQLPLVFVSTGQINAQLPFAITGQAQVTVTTAAGASAPVPVTILPVAPKLFTLTMDGKGEPIVLHANYTVVSSQSPAQPGEVVIVYLTGLGAVTPSLDAGAAAGDGSDAYPINYIQADVGVSVNGEPTSVQFAGLAPYFVGLYQLNVQLPAMLLPGANTFYVVSGQQASQDGVAMAINSNWKMLGSGTVAAAGGQISGTGISVTVPSGAVTTSQGVSVYANTSPPPASADPWRVSGVYSISGLPATTGAPITITMDLTPGATATGDIYVHVERTDDFEGSFLVPATVLNGRVTATIPAMTATGAASTASRAAPTAPGANFAATAHSEPAADATSNFTPTFTLWSLAGYHSLYSARNLFLITAPVSDAIQGGAEEVADQLVKTYDYIEQQLGLPWQTGAHSRNVPITVNIEVFTPDKAERWGEEGSTMLGVRNQCLRLNATFLQDSKNFVQMRLTASHELFHLMQNLWDPSSAPSTWLWMEEAMSTWMEKRMATDSNYVPPTVHGTAAVPGSTSDNYGFLTVHGLEFPPSGFSRLRKLQGNTGNVQEHGYGASQFLEFLTNKYGIQVVTQLLQTMAVPASGWFGSSLYSPVDAINSLSSQVGVDWRLFCENFMDGKVYRSPAVFPSAADIQSLATGSYYFTSPTTPGITFTKTYEDLSARVFSIGIKQPGWSQGTPLHLSLDAPGGEAEAIVYLFTPPGTLTKLAVFQNSYDIQNAENLTGKNQVLVIMVSEGRAVAPYTGSTQIGLTVTAGGTLDKIHHTLTVTASLNAAMTIRYVNGSTSTVGSLSLDPGFWISWTPYAFNGYPCQGTTTTWNGASFSLTGSCVYHNLPTGWLDYTYNMTGTLNAAGNAVNNGTFTTTEIDGRGTKDTLAFAVQGPIPQTSDTCSYGGGITFSLMNANLSSKVSGIQDTHREPTSSPAGDFDYASTDWSKPSSVQLQFNCK